MKISNERWKELMNLKELVFVKEEYLNTVKKIKISIISVESKEIIDTSIYDKWHKRLSNFSNSTKAMFKIDDSDNLNTIRQKLKPYYKKGNDPLEKLDWDKVPNLPEKGNTTYKCKGGPTSIAILSAVAEISFIDSNHNHKTFSLPFEDFIALGEVLKEVE